MKFKHGDRVKRIGTTNSGTVLDQVLYSSGVPCVYIKWDQPVDCTIEGESNTIQAMVSFCAIDKLEFAQTSDSSWESLWDEGAK